MKILIAPWGNPFAWQEVTYRFGDVEDNSKSSLKIIQQAIQPDKTIIIGLDTLA
ncbi:MAG TPA: CRISPR-associated protein, partial [Aquificae bacterium]|nr:CRISPR-associated protein [Aquificota bacterium]